ncbi:MAG: hydroxyethylthiazole kinase, partial [Bacteriovoracaceae bacterium]|nr:hydroxyethylthiazole kinase [Bacteriovoracaceae bacterium]
MNVTTKNLFESLQKVRAKNPLVHNITNLVVMDFSANALLSLGASPVMAHATQEVESFAKIAGALVINIGTLSSAWIESMQIALKSANQNNVPTVLDPVGAGATTFRTETVNALLSTGKFSVIRGNASEIMSLTSSLSNTKGVDSTAKSSDAVENAKILSNKTGSVVVVSGEKDFIVNGNQVTSLE